MFETDRLPGGWPERLNAVDEIWVPTEFHKDIFEKAGVRDVHVVGEPVDTTFFNPNGPRYAIEGVADDVFVVASVFKWEKRKGWDVLLKAWHAAKLPRGSAALVLLTNAYHGDDDFERQADVFVKEQLGDPEGLGALGTVKFLSGLSGEDLAALYFSAARLRLRRIAAAPRPRRGYSVELRRGGSIRSPPWPRRGSSVEMSRGGDIRPRRFRGDESAENRRAPQVPARGPRGAADARRGLGPAPRRGHGVGRGRRGDRVVGPDRVPRRDERLPAALVWARARRGRALRRPHVGGARRGALG